MICTHTRIIKAFKTAMSRQLNSRPLPAHNSCTQTAKFLLRSNIPRKPFCKVCFDAGKPESEYTSHCVKASDRMTGTTIITCPTLLNTECRYCYGLGHTAKFCPNLANKQSYKPAQQKPPVQQKPDRRGGFAALLDDNSDGEMETEKKEEFPALGEPSKRVSNVSNYASALASVAKPAVPKQVSLPTGFQVLHLGTKMEKTEVAKPVYKSTCKWAEESSDEEDEDEEYADNSAW